MFYRLTRGLPHEDLDDYDEMFLIHFYDRLMFLYHSLAKIGKEPNADLFQFMKGPSHQQTEEEIEYVFKNLGWDYSPIKLE